MEENTPKLSLIEKIQKFLIIRNLKNKNFKSYQSITSPSLKIDKEILELAWSIATPENYHLFPEEYQKLKFEQISKKGEVLKYLSPNIQEEICLKTPSLLINSSPEIQLKLGPNSQELIQNFDEDIQIKIALQNNELLRKCKEQVQEKIIEQHPALIYYCSHFVKLRELVDNNNSHLWECYLTNPNLSMKDKDFTGYLTPHIPLEIRSKYEAIFYDSRTEEQVKENLLIYSLKQGVYEFAKECSLETQEIIYRIIKSIPSNQRAYNDNKVVSPTGAFIRYQDFSEQFILKKLSEIYGTDKINEYKEFIDKLYKEYQWAKSEILKLFLNEKSAIIEKNEPREVISFLETYLRKDKEIKRQTDDEAEAYYYNQFFDLIKKAYGKEALEILKERPGINFEYIENLEIFSPEILNNFSKGFVHDLLSYDFGQEAFEITKIAKNQEDLRAFKLYYSRISNILGENALTMKLCISRYREYQDILKKASSQDLTEEQLQKLDALCMWPKNITNITKVEELDNLEERLKETIITATSEKKEIFTELELIDTFNINLDSESILFSYLNPPKDLIDMLSKEEIEILNYLKETDLLRKYSYPIGANTTLNQAIASKIPLSRIFLGKYALLTKIKNYEMKKFQEETITGIEAIEENIKTGKYGVKRIKVDGIEIIDLGTMPVNFAVHCPNMNNSGVHGDMDKIIEDYLTYEEQSGISTISARAEWEKHPNSYLYGVRYIYWDFDNNEVMGFKGNRIEGDPYSNGDSAVSHVGKQIKSTGGSDSSLREYKNQNAGTEIAFYRRYRNHKKIEESPKYGGKIIPNAIYLSTITPERLQIPTRIFGRNIPIICRGKLQTEEQIKKVTEMIKAQKQIQMFNQTFDKTEETIHSIGR